VEPGLGLAIAGPGIREYQLTNSNISQRGSVDPILVDPRDKPILRSFMDIPDHPRVTHAISVGSENKVHFTYDLDHGHIFQVWRGEFLDATPMWNSRGDGSSRPGGSIIHLGNPVISLAPLASEEELWKSDTTGSSFNPKGYRVNEKEELTFLYEAYGTSVEDGFSVLENGQGINREIQIQNVTEGLHFLLAQGDTIQELKEGLYLIDDKAYYLELGKEVTAKPIIRTVSGKHELVIPAQASISYSLLF
jgi:hypothetical protein